jgi:hypothetical protein
MATKSDETIAPAAKPTKAETYVNGSHAARVRAEHDERRTALLARDEVLAGEIQRREEERHDIGEALRLMSDPGAPAKVVVPLRQAGE